MRTVNVWAGDSVPVETHFSAMVCECGRCSNFIMSQSRRVSADGIACEMVILPIADIPKLIDDLMKLSLNGSAPS